MLSDALGRAYSLATEDQWQFEAQATAMQESFSSSLLLPKV